MRPKDKMRHQETLDIITRLLNEDIEKMAVILRHSHRYFGDDSAREPFLGLTEEGKAFAFDLGSRLPDTIRPRFFSSFFGRCIETAYVMDKGYTRTHGVLNDHNIMAESLAPFYVRDLTRALDIMSRVGTPAFLRSWFDNEIDDDIMCNPRQTADTITDFLKERLQALSSGEIALCVSHDWNLFPLKEFKLNLPHEEFGTVGFMEAVVLYEKEGRCYMTNYQGAPAPL